MTRWSSLGLACLAAALLVGGRLEAGVAMDTDADRKGWSPRQIASGFDSPKNPYRIADYDRIDPEYGTEADFKAFNDRAHELGMKVYMDLVYLHCGPNNVLKTLVPDGFQRTNGVVRTTRYNFPYLNFGSKALRAYLIESMRHWIRLGCDGFRCDVVAFVRGMADGGLFAAANLSGKPREAAYCDVPFATADPLLSEGGRREGSRLVFGPWGFGVFRLKAPDLRVGGNYMTLVRTERGNLI